MHELDMAFQNCVSMLSIIIKTKKLEHTRMLKMHNHLGLQIYHVFSCLLSLFVILKYYHTILNSVLCTLHIQFNTLGSFVFLNQS